MKSKTLNLILVFAAVGGVALALRSQPTTAAPPAESDNHEDGRYRLTIASNTTMGTTEYVIDSRTGRVWRSKIDQQRGLVVLSPETYENVDGNLSTIPNEYNTSVTVRSDQKKDNQK